MNLKNKWIILNLLILAGILAHSIQRDIELEKQYPADLRNRVVGARLQKDGKLPYFFHSRPSDSLRYTDPVANPDTTMVSNITASPFFHQLLYPVCDLPQRTFSRLWLAIEYLILFGIAGMLIRFATSQRQMLLVLNTAVLFTLTQAWMTHIAAGQLYLFAGFLICSVLCALLKDKKSFSILAGLLAAILVLTRPVALLIFIPFIFQPRKYFTFLASSFVFLAIYGSTLWISPFQKSLWVQYQQAIQKHIVIHQGGDKRVLFLNNTAYIPYLEGFSRDEVFKNIKEHPILSKKFEAGSFFVIFQNITHHKLPLNILNGMNLFNLVFFSALFFYYGRKHPPSIVQVFILGFLLYMMAEIWNPITRYQNNVVQWLPMLLAGMIYASARENWYKQPAFLLLVAGLFLSITNFHFIPDRNTLGELAWFFGLLILSFNFRSALRVENNLVT
jgi:hypothetical protein